MDNSFAIKRFLSYIFIFSFSSLLFCQTDIYLTQKTDSIINLLNTLTEQQINRLDGSNYVSQKKKIYKSRLEVLSEYAKDSNYVYDRVLEENFNKILSNIYEGNPELKKENFYFFFDRSFIPNAAAYGDGSFVVNLGLFDFLESDDEIAFVICHEIAHYLKDDVKSSIEKYVNDFNSDDTKSKIKSIKKQKYGQTKAGIELIKKISFDMFSYSREKEYVADEMGYELMKNTIYNPDIGVLALKKLGILEEIILNDSINIQNFLDFENYRFKKSWITKEQTLFSVKEEIDDYKFDKDSIRTHPYAKDRVLNLVTKKNADSLHVSQTSNILDVLKNRNQELIYQTLSDHKNFDILLYYLLKNNVDNDNPENYDKIGLALIDIYEAKKKHTLGIGISPPNPFSKEKYLDELKLFLTKTELYELSKISLNYADKYKDILSSETYSKIQNYFLKP